MEETTSVVIVGAGPSGLATSACLNVACVSNIVLEREDSYASLWRHKSYDRLSLHLAKQFCVLPNMAHSPSTPTYMPKASFVEYLDKYVSKFNINPRCNRLVLSARFDDQTSIKRWRIEAKNTNLDKMEVYIAEFLVIATGENSEGWIPELPGLNSFTGEIIHSSQYKSGKQFQGKDVLVVGCGNSGMEISFDLCNFGARTTLVVRNPFHILTKDMVYAAMFLLKLLSVETVDKITTTLAKWKFGNMTKLGLRRPTEGPFYLKGRTGRTPVIDVGTVSKIKAGEIKVMPAITTVETDQVIFKDGQLGKFDVIIFATGYKSSANKWLKDFEYILDEDGFPKQGHSPHWKGENGIYCVGLAKNGLFGISKDAKAVSGDISEILNARA